MKIAVVGLGLIGGSLARTIKSRTDYNVAGYDTDKKVMETAIKDGSIDYYCDSFGEFDLILVSLFPKNTVQFLAENIKDFSAGCLVIDCCGVKQYVCDSAKEIFSETDSLFLGGHPMAGREVEGYFNSTDTLFDGASMILTPPESFPKDTLKKAESFFLELGFGDITLTTPEHHDEVIAYTSQLAHVVSSAYMLSPIASEHMGFSAGSFADLTRVAKLNPYMWAELFLENSSPLVEQIDILIQSLIKYRDLIENSEQEELIDMLQKGNDTKVSLTSKT